jgi:hypothetical protein
MKTIFAKAILAASAVAAIGIAMVPAAASADELSNRIQNEQVRINQGLRSGQLTFAEFRATEGRLAEIAAQRRLDLCRHDGRLTFYDARQLNAELNGDSFRIFVDKHNAAVR